MSLVITILSSVLALVFLVLGGFHFLWVAGVKYGLASAIPVKPGDKPTLKPGKFATLLVGLALTSIAGFYVLQSGVIEVTGWELPIKIASWAIPILFTLRAIGEFKYVGFFKRVKGTQFSKMDTRLFSPLCLTIGIMGGVIAACL